MSKGKAEIGYADVALAVEHHVGRLEIAVQHAALVRRGKPGANLARDVDRLVLLDAPDSSDQRGEILAVDVLHCQEAAAVGLAEVVEPADILVRHLSGDAQLVVKLGQRRRTVRGALGEEFQRDGMIEREIFGAVHLTHPAATEQRDEPIAAGDDRARSEQAGARRRRP